MKKTFGLFLCYCCAAILFSSCSSQPGSNSSEEMQAPIQPLSCIAVLPVRTSVNQDTTIDYAKAQSLQDGAVYATDVINRELQGNPRVLFVTSSQVDSLVSQVTGGVSGTVGALGQKLKCDGVLLTTVSRFQQREGTEYSADSPASVDFSMVLRHSGQGNILWSADFREEQESFLSNILSFTKAKNRGFKWVSAEQLLEQGIIERLEDCPYLQ